MQAKNVLFIVHTKQRANEWNGVRRIKFLIKVKYYKCKMQMKILFQHRAIRNYEKVLC